MPACEDRIGEQIAYYRARAPEYESGLYDGVDDAMRRVLERVPPGSDVLELACGTGVWTERLAKRAAALTAVDAAPEMIELARVRAPGVTFLRADLLVWSGPGRRFDVVFFGFWLSHVPAQRFAEFWTMVGDCLIDGGRAVFVDEHVAGSSKERWLDDEIVERSLSDGSTYRIVKAYLDPPRLSAHLAHLGWSADIARVGADWVVGAATRTA